MSLEFIIIFWVIVAVVALIALLIHSVIVEGSSFDLGSIVEVFFESFGWATVLIVAVIGGIIFGFIAWIWWITLIIAILLVAVCGFTALVVYTFHSSNKKDEKKQGQKEIKTNYECKNCGSKLIKRIYIDKDGDEKVEYRCDYCDTVFGENEINGYPKIEQKKDTHDLDDWEEEYFEVCVLLRFKPQNNHTLKQVDRKIETLEEMYDSGSLSYDGDLDPEDALEFAYDFFSENMNEIEAYLKKYSQEEIKKRFECYLSSNDLE